MRSFTEKGGSNMDGEIASKEIERKRGELDEISQYLEESRSRF